MNIVIFVIFFNNTHDLTKKHDEELHTRLISLRIHFLVRKSDAASNSQNLSQTNHPIFTKKVFDSHDQISIVVMYIQILLDEINNNN
jgi:hypothetical protein